MYMFYGDNFHLQNKSSLLCVIKTRHTGMTLSDRFGGEQECLAVLHVVFAVLVSVRVTIHVRILFRHSLLLLWESQNIQGGIWFEIQTGQFPFNNLYSARRNFLVRILFSQTANSTHSLVWLCVVR